MLIHCTKKLLDQLKIVPTEHQQDESPLFSWHAHILTINRRKLVVVINDSNRYVLVLYGMKAKDFKNIDMHIKEALRLALRKQCVDKDIIKRYLDEIKEFKYLKSKNRTLVARLNKSCEAVKIYSNFIDPSNIYQTEVSYRCGYFLVGQGKNDYIFPREKLVEDLNDCFDGHSLKCTAVVLKITLDLVNAKCWRRVTIPLNITFNTLHDIIQKLFNWNNYHLHQFTVFDQKIIESKIVYLHKKERQTEHIIVPEQGAMSYKDIYGRCALENRVLLSEYLNLDLSEYPRIEYNYDFGDDWVHNIEVEKIIEDYDKGVAECIDGEGFSPPEDVGGKYGYMDFLKVIYDVNNDERENMLNWSKYQGFKEFNKDEINNRLKY
jgi:uncharacterized protein DUF6933/pRiA4b ORF-3-like protein